MVVSKKLFLIFSIIALAAVIVYPWKRVVVVPALRVRIVDESGSPAGGAVVKEEWEYRTLVSRGHKELLKTDKEGYVSLPERIERISLLNLGLSIAREIVHLPHGYGFGSYVAVWAYGKDPFVWHYVPFSWYEQFPDEIRLTREEEPEVP